MISIELTIGTPDLSMVAIWRENTAMSFGVMREPLPPNSGLVFGFTTIGVMPCLRSSARSRLALRADCSPFILTPRLSVPSHTKVGIASGRRAGALATVRAAFLVAAIRLPPISLFSLSSRG